MEKKSIYQQMKEAGVPTSSHCSDLYAEVNEKSREIVKNYEFRGNVTTFKNNVTGTLYYDIPFAFDPYWEQRGM